MAATGAELLASLLEHLDGQYADRFSGEWLSALDGCVLLTADEQEGPVHVLDAGRYRAVVVPTGRLMIVRVDTAGAVLAVEP